MYEFYRDRFKGAYEENEISSALKSAISIIYGCLCFAPVTEKQEYSLKQAICFQAEYLLDNEGYSSFSLGDFSVNGKNQGDANGICLASALILEKSGLTFRGGIII